MALRGEGMARVRRGTLDETKTSALCGECGEPIARQNKYRPWEHADTGKRVCIRTRQKVES